MVQQAASERGLLHKVATLTQKNEQSSPLTDIDLVKQWMQERTTTGQSYTMILHSDYARWMEKRSVEPLPLTEFGAALRLLNVDRHRDRCGSLVALALKPAPAKLKAQQQDQARQRKKLRRLFR